MWVNQKCYSCQRLKCADLVRDAFKTLIIYQVLKLKQKANLYNLSKISGDRQEHSNDGFEKGKLSEIQEVSYNIFLPLLVLWYYLFCVFTHLLFGMHAGNSRLSVMAQEMCVANLHPGSLSQFQYWWPTHTHTTTQMLYTWMHKGLMQTHTPLFFFFFF